MTGINYSQVKELGFGYKIIIIYCVVPKNIHTPTPPPPIENTFVLDPHPPGISIPGSAFIPSPTPKISVIFQLGWVPPGKNIYLKNAVALYFYTKDNCFCNKVRKSFYLC